MGKCLKLCVLVMGCVLAFGCSARKNVVEDDSLRANRFRRAYEAAFDNKQQQASQQILAKARSAIGTPYVRGGSTPDGFDCSGFVCWTYKSIGVNLPRTAREQSVVGQRINSVEDMREGDIVAFRHPKRGYHTGIYVGDGKFIHSPRRRTTVRVNSLDDPYFKNTFLGARRVSFQGGENLVAQAESRLSDFTAEKAARELSKNKKQPPKGKSSVKSRDASRGKITQVASAQKAPKEQKAAKASSADASKKKSGSAKNEASSKKASSRKVTAQTETKSKKEAPVKTKANKS